MTRVLFVDNFDSFTYNLVEYAEEALRAQESGADSVSAVETEVVKNTTSLDDIRDKNPDVIIISPGPGHPENERDVGVTNDVLRELSPEIPTLGVCLGLEAAVHVYGGTIGRAPEPIHGKAFPVEHDGIGVFDGIEQGFQAGRYHSLVSTAVPDCFEVSATTTHDGDELVMGVRHREHPIECVQFHPESVLTACGREIIENFLVRYTNTPAA
ncbi:anthranilate synthase component 2 [Haladaptatus litoreus]|uniref:anthranilate synthase n=1 Tax=Haladaptatus litoreus TaxID=553468 RepID=A0A1N6ZUF9_9EURY|nr:anthranilate synthase component II [Haladaptatus litoreus]SIR30424.1 anthranilate synthase component 2 [Haladaptatus litoreus]